MKTRLKEIYLFSALSENELDDLVAISTLHHYNKDELLFMKGDLGKHLLVVIEGEVSVYKHDDKANEVLIAFFSPNALVAEPAILAHKPFPSSARFKSKGSLIKIELKAFEKHFLSHSHVSREIINSLLDKINLLQANIKRTMVSSAKDKIVELYTDNASLVARLKNYELAALLGISAETFSRNVRDLVKENRLYKIDDGYSITKS